MEKNSEQKKEITMDELALMIAKGFGNIDERFSKVDERFNNVDERFNKVDKRFNKVDERLDKIETRLEDIEANLNKKVDKIDNNTLIYRVEKLEKKLA